MNKKSLIETNPYLKAPEDYRKALVKNVSSSTAIETGVPVETIARTLAKGKSSRAVKETKGSVQ
jgi:hypothetical protein